MDTSFLVVLAASLALLSGLSVVRLRAVGRSTSRSWLAVVELWAAVGLWVVLLNAVTTSARIGVGAGDEASAKGATWLTDMVRLAKAWPWHLAGAVVALLLAGHLMWSLRSGSLVHSSAAGEGD